MDLKIIVIYHSCAWNMNKEDMMDGLVPVAKGLRDELIQYGEFVPRESYVNPQSGTLWRKNPDGTLNDITKDKSRVLTALEHYGMNVEKTREKCRKGREEWTGEE
ncbi:hypothetical protein J2128_002312 [Methanomicrobium sp. W14]|uniref:hypothetical protein n=1 Tax=Methanomicrobium sp. W14 TaxID=2817839 RepID=UPI001AE7C022|nr:hypothetical protein [Methanomicrobium sp. W14]MBP2134346.1 hypothetical protein [Methanomicrobium sp. W14]